MKRLMMGLVMMAVVLGGCSSSKHALAGVGDTSRGTPGQQLTEGYKTPSTHPLGDFVVTYPTEQGTLRISHRSRPEAILWESLAGGFVAAAQAREEITESRGSVAIKEQVLRRWEAQSIGSIAAGDGRLTISGKLRGETGDIGYQLFFSVVSTNQLGFELALTGQPDLGRDPACYTLVHLRYRSAAGEKFFGFGEQFSYLDMKGRRLPILTQEQGIGRGKQPVTALVNMFAPGSGGTWYSSYAAVPFYLTNTRRALFLENSEIAIFDLERPEAVEITLFGPRMQGRIINGDSPRRIIEEFTAYAGRMQPLPDWINQGAIVGMQGGTEAVRSKLELLRRYATPMGAFWLQDWVGKRKTMFGSQLWWNWELDEQHYPGWAALCQTLRNERGLSGDGQGIRVMTYLNPFLADVAGKPSVKRNLLAEARDKGYLVKNRQGQAYMIPNTSFDAGLIDLTNPAARDWIKAVIKDQVIGVGAAGWMADFGEALPFDAVLFSGIPAAVYHNRYPEEWARLNREVLQEVGGDIVFFSRSGFTRSPGFATLFWLGDQLVSFDEADGLKSAITGMLAGGLSGYSLNHSDIGGYTTLSPLYTRSKELLLRWMELSAFTAVYRTHEGNQPEKNVQFSTDAETLAHFARFAKVYRALAPYRRTLMQEAAAKGYPIARHPMLEFPDDPRVYDLRYQWMLGSEFMVAPVTGCLQRWVRVYLPQGTWIHVWNGKAYGNETRGGWYCVWAPLGQPAVFYKKGSPAGEEFVQQLKAIVEKGDGARP